jgi:hypothetical protein
MQTVYDEIKEFEGEEDMSEESKRLLQMIHLEMSKIPPDSAPVYTLPPPPEEEEEEEIIPNLKEELEEYTNIIGRVANLQQYVLDQINATHKLGELEHIMREMVSFQHTLMHRMSKITETLDHNSEIACRKPLGSQPPLKIDSA